MTGETGESASGKHIIVNGLWYDDVEMKDAKISKASIETLNTKNARSWFYKMESHLSFEQYWKAIEERVKLGEDQYDKLMTLEGWCQRDAGARIIIERGLKDHTMLNLRHTKHAGGLWEELKKRFLKRTESDICNAIDDVVGWRKDPRMNLEESLDSLEQLAHIMKEQSGFDIPDPVLRIMWMRGLPPQYRTAIENVKTSGVSDRSDMLHRLQSVKRVSQETGRKATTGFRCYIVISQVTRQAIVANRNAEITIKRLVTEMKSRAIVVADITATSNIKTAPKRQTTTTSTSKNQKVTPRSRQTRLNRIESESIFIKSEWHDRTMCGASIAEQPNTALVASKTSRSSIIAIVMFWELPETQQPLKELGLSKSI